MQLPAVRPGIARLRQGIERGRRCVVSIPFLTEQTHPEVEGDVWRNCGLSHLLDEELIDCVRPGAGQLELCGCVEVGPVERQRRGIVPVSRGKLQKGAPEPQETRGVGLTADP